MYFLALATDYDGTLARDGVVAANAVAAIRRLKNSGRRLILVTGRELPNLQRAFPELAHCDLIVAENGALLYEPGTGRETVLAPAPPDAFVPGCASAACIRCRSAAASSPAGSRCRESCSRRCASWASSCRSCSTRAP